MTVQHPRVVGAVRLSRYTDESTSQEVQEEMVTDACRRIGGRFVGWARDIDVSALKTTPFERPELREWLDTPDAWDVMIWQRLDRAVRSMSDMADLGRFAKRHKKRLIFASGPGGQQLELDFSSPMSEIILMILAFAAELEGRTIMERTQGTARYLQTIGRWSGGVLPYGYQPVRKMFPDGNEGWWLAIHEPTARVRREMIRRAIDGASYRGITDWLNESGAVTPINHRAAMATPPRGPDPSSRWQSTAVRAMLRSAVVRGYVVKGDGTVVRDQEGAPVMQGEPLIDDKTWYTLVEALKERDKPELQAPRRKDAHPLLGVLVCGTCGRNMQTGRRKLPSTGEYEAQFRCAGYEHPKDKPAPTIPQAATLTWVEDQFLRKLGFFKRVEMVRVAGVDYTAEISELTAEIEELTSRLARLRGVAADVVEKQINARAERIEHLASIPAQAPRMVERELEETWEEAWQRASQAERREMLLAVGARVEVGPLTGWRRPVGERLTFRLGVHDSPAGDAQRQTALSSEEA